MLVSKMTQVLAFAFPHALSKCWWFCFCCLYKFTRGCCRLHPAACHFVFSPATDVCIHSISFPLALSKTFPDKLSIHMMNFICLLQKAAYHALVVKKRNGKYSQINCSEVNNRCWTRKQLESSQDDFWHDNHTCCIASVTQIANFGSKWLISYAFVQHVTW